MAKEYIRFDEMPRIAPRKTHTWEVRTIRDGFVLGFISWYSHWRQYCFLPCADTVFSKDCLERISSFIRNI